MANFYDVSSRIMEQILAEYRANRSSYDQQEKEIFAKIRGKAAVNKPVLLNILQKLNSVKSYLELGVYNGLSMAHVIHQTRAPVQCVGVDAFTDPNPRTKGDPEERASVEAALREMNTSNSTVQLIQGASDRPTTIAAVRSALGGKQVDLLFMNRNNQYSAAAMDFRNYAGMLSVGGYLVVDDANSGFPGIQKFLQESVLTSRKFRVLGVFEGSMLVAQKLSL